MQARSPSRSSSRVIVVIVAGVAFLVAACGTHQPPPRSSPPATFSSPTPSLDSSQAAATADILAVFRNYWDADQQANESGTDHPRDELKKYLADPLLTEVVAGLVQNRQKGVYYAGSATADPKVTKLNLADQPPTAVITSCEDYTNYRLTYRASKSPVPVPSGNRRYVISYTATRYEPQGWLLSKADSDRSRTC